MSRSGFAHLLESRGLSLVRAVTSTLQVNLGLACDLSCRHCHLEAGPARSEMMSPETARAVIDCARRLPFGTIDLTGGAPELLPHLPALIEELAPLTPHLIVRSNLVSLEREESWHLPELYRRHRVAIAASLPALNASQTDTQRGRGVWETSISALRNLNRLGYGIEGSGLRLDLISNPAGAFLPPDQAQTEARFRQELDRRHGIRFTSLFTFANAPLGRFRAWLEASGNLERYMDRLRENFNPCTLGGVMCRSLLSVDWRGFLFDCDFNQAAGLYLGEHRIHIGQLDTLPEEGIPIRTGDHCFACTAGSGFT